MSSKITEEGGKFFIEDYELLYGKRDYEGKKVLEIGADVGTTAHFFINKGASQVISVEGNRKRFEAMVINAQNEPRCFPLFLYVKSPDEIGGLLYTFRPDFVHMDCEGCERNLTGVRDEFFKIPKEYQLEVHNDEIWANVKEKLEQSGFEIKDIYRFPHSPSVRIIYAVRKEEVNENKTSEPKRD